jgi:Na+/H+-dicarboxylate symporter
MLAFARAVAPAQAVATSTQSSLASLPAMLESTRALGVPARCRHGAAARGVGLPHHLAGGQPRGRVLFAALFGIEPTLPQYLAGVALALAMSFAAVGLPGQITFFASIVPICGAMGVPVGALPLLLAVETIPDIFRTIGNVTADVGVTAALARSRAAAGMHVEPLPEPPA